MKHINLDHLSANPLLPEVQDAMIAAIREDHGNPSSQHSKGEKALEALNRARASVAHLLNSKHPGEIVFTSGGTESINHAVKGVALSQSKKGKHIVTSNIEHSAVLRSIKRLHTMGYKVTSIPVDETGRVNPEAIAKAITDETILVSVMHSNNEIGTIQPIEEISRITREKGVIFHTDASASVGVVPIDVQKLGVDLLSFAANNFYGPAGVGGLYIRKGTPVWPLLEGGVQENNKRAGTENLIGVIGTGVAADLAKRDMESRIAHVSGLKELLLRELPNYLDNYFINGHPEHTLPNMVSVSIQYIEGESVVLMLDDEGIAVSTRSACAAGSLRASHVLLSVGRDYADAQGTMVLTFGVDNEGEDIMKFLESVKDVVKTLRKISPLYHQDEG